MANSSKSYSTKSPKRTRQSNSNLVNNIKSSSKNSYNRTRKTRQSTSLPKNADKQEQPVPVTSEEGKRRKRPSTNQNRKTSANMTTQNGISDDTSCTFVTKLDEAKQNVEELEQCADQTCDVDNIPEYFKTDYNKDVSNKETQTVKIPENFQAQVVSLEEEFAEERREIRDKYISQFERWFDILEEFNILCYGYGSKRNVLNAFAEYCKQRSSTIIVHGYHIHFSLKELLCRIEKEILHLKIEMSNKRTPTEQVRCIERHLSKDSFSSSIYMVIHNIDGPKMQSLEVQEIWSHIASIPHMKIIASIDHFNAPLLWNRDIYHRLNWYWEQVFTEDSYVFEISDTSFLINGEGDESRVKAAVLLFNTLTKNASQIFMELAALSDHSQENLLHNSGKSTKSKPKLCGVSFQALYEHCRKKFLVSNPNSLKSILKELKDHELVSIASSSISAETVKIELKPKQLEAVISILQAQLSNS